MNLGARIGMWSDGANKLYDSEVEYLEMPSDRNMWFGYDLPIPFNLPNNFVFRTEIAVKTRSNYVAYSSLMNGSNQWSVSLLSFVNPDFRAVCCFNQAIIQATQREGFSVYQVSRIEEDAIRLHIDGVETGSAIPVYNKNAECSQLALFCICQGQQDAWWSGAYRPLAGAKVGATKLVDLDSGEALLDVRPVRVGGEGRYIDMLTGKFIANRGTTPPVLGPDCPPRDWELSV